MTTVLVGVDAVDASARVADRLGPRLDGDAVHAAAPLPPDAGREATRDAEDALNVVRSRLGVVASVALHRVEGDFAAGLRALAAEVGADELAVASADGAAWVETVAAESDRPTTVIDVG